MSVNEVVQTLLASYDVGATPQQRAAAAQIFEQLKSGDLHASAAVCVELAHPGQPLEAQALGYAVLQHLVGNRWDAFAEQDRSQLASMAYSLLQQSTTSGASWVIRSKAALLLALVMKRSGSEFLEASLSQLLSLAVQGPAVQEIVCLVLRYISDEVMVLPEEDLVGEKLRLLVASMTKTLAAVLQFLEQTVEANLQAAQASGNAGAKDAASAVQGAVAAAATYAEWAPVADLQSSGLLAACGYMLDLADFREAACAVLRHAAGRKLSVDEPAEGFAAGQMQVAEALSAVAGKLLAPGAAGEMAFEGANEEFGQLVCETMTTLGSMHLTVALPAADARLRFLQHMLAFAQHAHLPLADKALALWMKLLQDAASCAMSASSAAAAAAPSSSAGGVAAKGPLPGRLPHEAISALMLLAADQLQQRVSHLPQEDQDEVPPYFDTFEDFKEFMVGYRAKLTSIARHAAAVVPEQALAAAGTRLGEAEAAAAAATASGAGLEQARNLLESAVMFLESTFKAVWDAPAGQDQAARAAAVAPAAEHMLRATLSLQVTDAVLLQQQARGLEAFGRLLAARRELVPGVVARLFELLVGCIPLEEHGHLVPPGNPPPGWRDGSTARSSVAGVFLSYARACPEAFLPHLEAIATRSTELWESGALRPGERNSISEGILAASLAGPEPLRLSVAEWVLAPVRALWTTQEWQASLASPEAFIQHYMPVQQDSSGGGGVLIGAAPARWALYHQVHLIERAMRRMPGAGSPGSHPLAAHMPWALPSLLRLVVCLNAMQSPAGRAALGAAAGALQLSPQERTAYVRSGPTARRVTLAGAGAGGAAAGGAGQADAQGDYSTVGGTTVASLRAWLRHLREFSYHSLGMLPAAVPPALELTDVRAALAPSLFAYADCLQHQNLRLALRHVAIPHVRTLPVRHLQGWALPTLALLAPHMQKRLAAGWAQLAASRGGQAGPSTEDSAAANEEIIQEKLLRELTQEYADLLRDVAARLLEDPPPTAPGVLPAPPLQQPSAPGKASKAPTLLEMLLEREPAAGIAAATVAVAGMQWPDGAGFRFAMFCRALAVLAPRDPQLYAFVGSEVLRAAISCLALELMAPHHTEILGLIRLVLVQQVGDPAAAVHGVLRSLPGMTPERVAAFSQRFLGTKGEKDQRNAIKRLLLEVGGTGSFAALATWRQPNAPSVAAAKPRVVHAGSLKTADEAAAEDQLQGDITRALFAA